MNSLHPFNERMDHIQHVDESIKALFIQWIDQNEKHVDELIFDE